MPANNYNKRVLYDRGSSQSLESFVSYLRDASRWYLVIDRRGPQWVSETPAYLMRDFDVEDLARRLDSDGIGKYTCQVSAFSAELITDSGVVYVYRLDPGRLSDMVLGPDRLAYPKKLPKEAEREVRMAIIHFK